MSLHYQIAVGGVCALQMLILHDVGLQIRLSRLQPLKLFTIHFSLFTYHFSLARLDLPLQLCWLATEGTQESNRNEYKHL